MSLNRLKLATAVVMMVAICSFLSGCASIAENLIIPKKEADREFQRRHEDPQVMADEIDRKRRAETLSGIKTQQEKEDAVRNKQLNELIDKQLRNQQNGVQ